MRPLHQLCRTGHLYEVERWIAAGEPLQLAPEAIPEKRARPKTALQIALETGQHSLALLLLRSGYRLELEQYGPLDIALQSRRWDLFDLLVEWGGNIEDADVYSVLNSYNTELYERFWAEGYDLTKRHEMSDVLGLSSSNRPLFGFVKRHRAEDPRLQRELDIALGIQVRAGKERGIALCLWAGANPHVPAPDLNLRIFDEAESEDEEESYRGWSSITEAARAGNLAVLKCLKPDPTRDDFDELYEQASNESIVEFLLKMQPPKNLTPILSWQFWRLEDHFLSPGTGYRGTGMIEAILKCGVRWEEANPEPLARIRGSLSKLKDHHFKEIVLCLEQPEICAPETYHELVRTPKMQAQLIALGIKKKPVTEREKRKAEGEKRKAELEQRKRETRRLLERYDRKVLYEQLWARPALSVAKDYGVSSVWLGKVCRLLNVPVPPRGYWARVQSGYKGKKPPLPK
jgi:ankyrin repeat protein